MHVTPGSTCQSCQEKLSRCHNTLKLWFEIISANFKDCHIAVGYRDQQDQDIAMQNHLTHAPWPKSKHNRTNAGICESWAMDLFRLGDDGKAYFEAEYFSKIWDLINNIQTNAGDQELYWGGLFKSLPDEDHFELLKTEVVQTIEVLSQDKC